ncbi:NYN domain-containing protein [Luteibacter sp. UNCMF366Tsu5.1]|uniref:NYN domain-containing protein n=1 Tax=Luteibacter sp. UNCMF366Tsu5.1 TaxID=1502758 RepID=UPI000908DA50|nr:NYN domain-containing protein [Luteibacter sp. UNCMF366Tsu5.1]SFW74412.1 NYN domain-containing protein [Luteibacter sp. UNCMF366Tsu5.1]
MRIAVFIDYWNFQLTLNQCVAKRMGKSDVRFMIDWKNVGRILADEACRKVLEVDPVRMSYEGCYIYTSFNPSTDEGVKFRKWATTWLDRQPGINVEIRERKPKALPRCPICHREISHCPHAGCEKPIVATVEKGVDTLIVTDLIRLGVQNAYDAAVLVSSDADMVPAVQFIQTQGRKIVQAGFPPMGVDLATESWGSFDIMARVSEIERAP